MPSAALIREICERYKSSGFYVAPIPPLQHNNARAALGIPVEEGMIGLIYLTLFGSCTNAIAFCSGGIYQKNIGGSPDYMPWQELANLTFEHVTSLFTNELKFSDGRRWDLSGVHSELTGNIPLMFLALQELVVKSQTVMPTVEWRVAVHQQQFGPYETDTLQSLVASGQIDSSVALVWRDGMANWSPYNNVPELETFQKRAVAPPLPPTQSADSDLVLAEEVETEPRRGQPARAATDQLVDLNNAPLDDLLYLPGLTLASAKRLIEQRQSRLGFHTIEEVGELLDLPPHKVQRLRERVLFKPFSVTGSVTSARNRVVDF